MNFKTPAKRRTFAVKPVVTIALMALVAGCMRWGEDRDEESLKKSFKEVIGFDAPAAVTNKKSAYYWVRDSYSKWLYFVCEDATISKIRGLDRGRPREAGYWRSSGGPGRHDGTNPNAPSWWKNVSDHPELEEIDIDRSKIDTNTDVTHIWIDKRSRRVYAVRDVLE